MLSGKTVAAGALLVAAGCKQGDLPGQYFAMTLTPTENLCTGNGTGQPETYEYRVELDGNDATLSIDEDVWATGTVNGCNVTYTSLAWSDIRDGYEIKWEIQGDATVNFGGGGGCVEQHDWEGEETFLITESAHPDVAAGCTYTLSAVGKFEREVEAP
jgi:hypothetical protein